jgi:hypothetical protein
MPAKGIDKLDTKTRAMVLNMMVECDEILSFVYAKDKNVKTATTAPDGAGDVWTWTAIDADSKMILSYEVGDRSGDTAYELMVDLSPRLANRVQLTTDGHRAHLDAIEGAFGGDIDYAMLVKQYGGSTGNQGHEKKYSPAESIGIKKEQVFGEPVKELVSTSYVERQDLFMCMRRFTRLTNGFSKNLENHMEWIVGSIDAIAPAPKTRGSYKKRNSN